MKRKALVIGAGGFVGSYLIAELIDAGYEVAATKMTAEALGLEDVVVYDLDILDPDAIGGVLTRTAPDIIFHLAAQSSVAVSWKRPALTIDVNVKGTANVLEAVRDSGRHPRIMLIGSAEEYGPVQLEDNPIDEGHALHPGNIYAATKACQGMLGELYAKAYDMDIVMVRAFNHIGPGQAEIFVLSDFCKQVACIEAGLHAPVMQVGNLAAKRDFTDVRDVMRAYRLLAEMGISGETYNVGSGCAVAIEDVLDMILAQARCPIVVEHDPARLRPVDVPVIAADVAKLYAATGWTPDHPLEKSISDVLGYWRGRYADSPQG